MSKTSDPITGWLAEIFLRYEVRRGITRLVDRKQKGPLMVQRPFYPEQGVAHTYLLHPPGGIVGGDELDINIYVADGAHALLTMPGATKFYRSAGHCAKQVQRLTVENNGFLEWLPQENIFFPQANAALETHISLTGSARFIGWEIQCFGRPVLNELFTEGQVSGQLRFTVDHKLILAESMYINGLEKKAAAMREYPMWASLYIAPASESVKSLIQSCLEQYSAQNIAVIEYGLTDVDGLLIVRLLGHQTEPMMACLVQIWQAVRQKWLGYRPQPPRIWAT